MQHLDSFMLYRFANELVAHRISATEDPCADAAAVVSEAARVALTARPGEAEQVVSDACYGGLQALFMAGQDLSRGSALMLEAMAELGGPLGLDPADLMRYSLDGFARMRGLITQGQIIDILDTLERHFNGTGEAFAAALARQPVIGLTRSSAR